MSVLRPLPRTSTGMKAAQGILTVRGGMTSHAAVVARGMGTCCVSGCGDIAMDEANKKFTLAGKTYPRGRLSSPSTVPPVTFTTVSSPPLTLRSPASSAESWAWADKYRKLECPHQRRHSRAMPRRHVSWAPRASAFAAPSICSSMPSRIAAFREMICSDTVEDREAALDKILPYQQGDFEALYEALEGTPVTIRFLDPPLHEFVPTEEEDIEDACQTHRARRVEEIKNIIAALHEFNPMMGHRGCRLTVTYPEIAKMQTTAVIRAAINVQKKHPDWKVVPEIMIPLVGEVKELKFVKKIVVETADAEIKAAGIRPQV